MLQRRVFYVILLVASVALYLTFYNYIALVVLLLVAIAPVFLYLILIIARIFTKIEISCDDIFISPHHPAKLSITATNKSIFPVPVMVATLFMQNSITQKSEKKLITMAVAPLAKTSCDAEITSQFCGIISVSISRIKLFDLAGLTSITSRKKRSSQIISFPQIFDVVPSPVVSVPSVEDYDIYSQTKGGDDISQIFDYHEYREGDKLKNINWKLSSKWDALMVREGSLPIESSVCIAIELPTPTLENGEATDSALCVLSSLSTAFINESCSHDITFYSKAEQATVNATITNEEDLFSSLFDLMRDYGENDTAFNNLSENTQYSEIYYITTNLRNELLKMLSECKNVKLAWIKPAGSSFSQSLTSASQTFNLPIVTIECDDIENGLTELSTAQYGGGQNV